MTLQQRLDTLARQGALSHQDLATWLDLPYETIRSWRRGSIPLVSRRQQIEERLVLLEKAIKAGRDFPIPLAVRAHERKNYILRVLNRVRRGK